MRARLRTLIALPLALLLALAMAPVATAQSEIPAGTHFMAELRTKLEAQKVKRGKEFEARTLEALQAPNGSFIAAGARLKGHVSSVEHNRMMLRFEQIDTGNGWVPIVATVAGVPGEKDVRERASEEGEIKAKGGRGKGAAIGTLVGAGAGAGIGAAKAGGRGAEIGAGAGALGGLLIGAAAGGKDLVLDKGTRIELELDRPLLFTSRWNQRY